MVHPRRLLVFLLVAAVVFMIGQFLRSGPQPPFEPRAAVTGAPPAATSAPQHRAVRVKPARPGTSGKFRYVPGSGPVLGRAGPIRRFKVAVELPVGATTATSFADEVDRTLGDGRSWIAAKRFRLQRVPYAAPAEFVIYLASARTSQRMCRHGGLETGGFTSCRLPHQVIINDSRWAESVPDYGAPLGAYRAYAINHEVGHQLGHGHETCPGRGRPAPVMMQQTYGLRGCTANPWPYVNGGRYTGPSTS